MRNKILILEGHGRAWKTALFKVFKEKYENAVYVDNAATANSILYNGYAVIDANEVDIDSIYIPRDSKVICISINSNSNKRYENCNIYYRFDKTSSPSSLIDVVNKM